jgi:hypothetical protein
MLSRNTCTVTTAHPPVDKLGVTCIKEALALSRFVIALASVGTF